MDYRSLCQHIAEIAQGCGRDPADIKLMAVSKGYPWSHVRTAYEQGCRDFGENRLQETEEKRGEAPNDVKWHLIGSLQKNKVRKAIGQFCLIHSVDSVELAEKISSASLEAGIVTAILLQANVSGEASKHGLTGEQWRCEFEKVRNLPGIQLCGWMTMAPFVEDEGIIRSCFAALRNLRDELGGGPHLSMGMTHDYPIAIQEGATLLRIGTALFGP